MTPTRTLGALRPMEAYRALSRFAGRRGPAAMRLAMHAAVPQSFRAELLHLLKLNFVPEAADDAAVEADVLLAPFSDDLGGGYFQFDPEVRRLLLDELGDTYADEPVHRVRRVADFLLAYVERAERRAPAAHDRLGREFLETQRWVALAFARPDAAAEQLAAALQAAEQAPALEARLHLGGLAHAVAIPLAHHRQLLDYALALHALETGDRETATDLLEPLQREFTVGGVTLSPPRVMPPRPPAAPPVEPAEAASSSDAAVAQSREGVESPPAAETTEPPPLRVYISSSLVRELRLYREAAADACNRLGLVPVMMEEWAPDDRTPQDRSLDELGRADMYLCIVGRDYGYVPRGQKRSLVEIEYDYAVGAGLPIFCFLLDEEHVRPSGDHKRLKAFRDKIVNSRAAAFTSDVRDFSGQVYHTLQGWKEFRRRATESASQEFPPLVETAARKPLRKLFLSYDRAEQSFAERLYQDLQRVGFEVWMDIFELRSNDPLVPAIQEALAGSDGLVFVMTAQTHARHFMQMELQVALLAELPVFPVLRGGLLPGDLPEQLAHRTPIDFREERSYADAFGELLHALGAPRADEPGLGPLLGVPRLRADFVGREEELARLRDMVLAGTPRVTVLAGQAGVGKTALAAVLAHDEAIRRRFADGILWATAGADATVEQVVGMLSRALGEVVSVAATLHGRSCLLILNDVEDASMVPYLASFVGVQGHVLVTTRQPELASRLGAGLLYLEGLPTPDALRLVARRLDEMPDGAVYISYASEDRAAAERLAAGLGQVTDVWLDRDVLSGGEEYDQQLYRRIRRCSLFMPVLSRSAVARLEGYFRREWRWAVEKSIVVAPGMPFIVPVIIDDLPVGVEGPPRAFWDFEAAVLPDGYVTPEFAAEIASQLRRVRSARRRAGSADSGRGQGAGLSPRLGERIVRDKDAVDLSRNPEFASFQFLGYSASAAAVEMVALCDADGFTEGDIVRLRDEFFDIVRKVAHDYGLNPRGRNPNGLLGFVFAQGCPPDLARFIARQTRISHAADNGGIVVSWAIDATEGRIHTHDNPVSVSPPVVVSPQSVFPGLRFLESLLARLPGTEPDSAGDDEVPVSQAAPEPRPESTGILFVPVGTGALLELDWEFKRIETEFRLARTRDRLSMRRMGWTSIERLRQAMLDEPPTIVHFSAQSGQTEGIVLQGDAGEPYVVPGEVLESVFQLFPDMVKCVVLNACWSDSQAQAIRRHVPHVVGSRAGIREDTAVAFLTTFYRALAAGRDVPLAFRLGRATVQMERDEYADLVTMI